MKDLRRIATAGVNGVVATAVDVGTLVLLHGHFNMPVAAAAFCSSTAGGVTNYVLNKYLAFQDHSRVNVRQLARFAIVAVITACLLAASMEVVSVWLGVEYVVAKLICAAVVFGVWTYPAQRRLVFPHRAQRAPSVSHHALAA